MNFQKSKPNLAVEVHLLPNFMNLIVLQLLILILPWFMSMKRLLGIFKSIIAAKGGMNISKSLSKSI